MIGRVLGFILGVLVIAGVLLFGGLLMPKSKKNTHIKNVELLSGDMQKEEKKVEQPPPEKPPEELQAQKDQPPEISEVTAAPQMSDNTPALDAASLSSIMSALNPGSGGGEFGSSVNLASGGRIGGTGKAGSQANESLDKAFGMDDIDQKPRVIVQTPPAYPAELRGKKMGGVVQVAFVVTASGQVANPHVENTSHPAFGAPALAAVRQWRFEPAVRGGTRVKCRMRVPIKFQAG